jgi:maltooligosyltrehalose trehalohydrolase
VKHRVDSNPEIAWMLSWGAQVMPRGGVCFRTWAPAAASLAIKLEGGAGRLLPMMRHESGVFEITVPEIGAGTDYRLVFDDGRERPDPFSRWQPQGVHGPSRVVDAGAFAWSDGDWTGLPLEDHILYEIHVGTFTPQGTFEAIIPRLPELLDLGVTALQLMPVAEFPGSRNWGYDGVSLFAPHSAYGGPEGLKRLVDATHRVGLAIHLDVVYNHLGPEGNYLGEFGPYLSQRHHTPWGPAFNLDGPDSHHARRFVIDNALYWQSEYHIDGLRLDAVHGFHDTSERHILAEIAEEVHRQERQSVRRCWIIAESDLNDPVILHEPERGGFGLDSQWSNDFHHSLHAALLGSGQGYFRDFGKIEDLATALTHGFVYQGQFSVYRGREHGKPPVGIDGHHFVVFIQNHDQVANPYRGNRLPALASAGQHKLAACILFCAPGLPLLFMGEEYAESAPFYFFTSFGDPGVIEGARRGRKREHDAAAEPGPPQPDPQDAGTFERSRLGWELRKEPQNARILACYRDLSALRREVGCLRDYRRQATRTWQDEELRWLILLRGEAGGDAALLICNFADNRREIVLPEIEGRWRLRLWTDDPGYGGAPHTEPPPQEINPGSAAGISLSAHSAAIYLKPEA